MKDGRWVWACAWDPGPGGRGGGASWTGDVCWVITAGETAVRGGTHQVSGARQASAVKGSHEAHSGCVTEGSAVLPPPIAGSSTSFLEGGPERPRLGSGLGRGRQVACAPGERVWVRCLQSQFSFQGEGRGAGLVGGRMGGPASYLHQFLGSGPCGSALLGTHGQDSMSLWALVFSCVRRDVMLSSWRLSLAGTAQALPFEGRVSDDYGGRGE